MTFLITGASRGIGFELTQQALTGGHKVFACYRSSPKELEKLMIDFKNQLNLVELDASSDESTLKASKKISDPIDVLINNAGVYLDSNADSLSKLTSDTVLKTFETNTVGPLRVTKAFESHLKKSNAPTVVNITSLMGSMTDNKGGTAYAYRMSKAALNMFTKNLSIENPDWKVLSVHPGWVQTDMGGKGATVTALQSATGILKLAQDSAKESSGKFYDFRGRELPW